MPRPRKDEPKKNAPESTEDVVLVHGRTEDGEGLSVLRKRGETILAGEVRPMREGQPITGDVVRLRPRENAPMLADVEVVHAHPTAVKTEDTRGGPAQVSTPAYRAGWSAIFGEKRRPTKTETRHLN